jgi:hypothetical protein
MDHDRLSIHGGLVIMEWHDHSIAQEVVVIAWKEREREREYVIGVLTIDATWRRSYEDGHITVLNRGGRWCSDGEMVPSVRRRDWSRGGCSRSWGALVTLFIGS